MLLETIEQACFRHGSGEARSRRASTIAGRFLDVLGMAVWLVVLRGVPLRQAMPLLAANNVTVALAGAWLVGERVTRRRWAGIALITAGVALVGSAGAWTRPPPSRSPTSRSGEPGASSRSGSGRS